MKRVEEAADHPATHRCPSTPITGLVSIGLLLVHLVLLLVLGLLLVLLRPLFARRSKYLSRDIYYHYTNKGVTVGHGLPATRLSRSGVFLGEEDSISVQAGFLMGKKIGRKNDDSTADPINCLFYKDRRERLFNAIVIRG